MCVCVSVCAEIQTIGPISMKFGAIEENGFCVCLKKSGLGVAS
jgi:hypothetical protein